MHLPGHGYGLVNTVTGATPLRVRIGFMRTRSRKGASASSQPFTRSEEMAEAADDLALRERPFALFGVLAHQLVQLRRIEGVQLTNLQDDRQQLTLVQLGLETMGRRAHGGVLGGVRRPYHAGANLDLLRCPSASRPDSRRQHRRAPGAGEAPPRQHRTASGADAFTFRKHLGAYGADVFAVRKHLGPAVLTLSPSVSTWGPAVLTFRRPSAPGGLRC